MSKSMIDHMSTQKFSQDRHSFQPQNSGRQIDSINIGLASPIRIRKWAERILPNGKKIGEVINSKTVNYKTLKPEVGGLFCEKIFGPIEDFECLCAPTKRKSKTQNKFCPDCDVEFTVARVRRYRLGYIKLASPVSHIWYLRGRPRFLNILFDRAIALKTGKKKGKIKDFKPIIYGIDGIYVPILRLIKIRTKISSDKLVEKTSSIIKKTVLSTEVNEVSRVKKNKVFFAKWEKNRNDFYGASKGHRFCELKLNSIENDDFFRHSMFRIKPKLGLQNKKKSLFLLRSRLLGLKKPERSMKILPRFPTFFAVQSKVTRFDEPTSQQWKNCLHPFARKRKKIDPSQFSLQSLNFSNFPYYTVCLPKFRNCSYSEATPNRKTAFSSVSSKKQGAHETILQKLPTKLYDSLFQYNFFEKNGLLWHDLANYNVNPNIYNTLQFFLKTRYFTRTSRNAFFKTLDKRNILFKKKFSKIVCNSCHSRYNINSSDTSDKQDLDVNSIKFNSRLPKRTSSLSKKNKNVVIDSKKQKKLNGFLCEKKLFLNRRVLKIESLNFFTEKKSSTLPVGQYGNQLSLGFSLLKSKFFCFQKNLLVKTKFVQRSNFVYETCTPTSPSKKNLLNFSRHNLRSRLRCFATQRRKNQRFFPSQTGVEKTKFFNRGLKVKNLGNTTFLDKGYIPMDWNFFSSRLSKLKNGDDSSFMPKFIDGELKPTNLFFKIISSTPDKSKVPGFMTFTSSIKPALCAKKTYNKSSGMSKNVSSTKQTKIFSASLGKTSFFLSTGKNRSNFSYNGTLRKTMYSGEPPEFIQRNFYTLPGLGLEKSQYSEGSFPEKSSIFPFARCFATQKKKKQRFLPLRCKTTEQNKGTGQLSAFKRSWFVPKRNLMLASFERTKFFLVTKKNNSIASRFDKNQCFPFQPVSPLQNGAYNPNILSSFLLKFSTTTKAKKSVPLQEEDLRRSWVGLVKTSPQVVRRGKKNLLDFSYRFGRTSHQGDFPFVEKQGFLPLRCKATGPLTKNSPCVYRENVSRFSKQSKAEGNLQSQIDPYYPLSSRCVFKFIKGDENKTLEFKALWSSFVKYMTSNFVKQDAIIHHYSNRLGNRFIIQNGFEYKYIKVVLTGSEAICYWLKNLNLHVLESILKKKIKNLDDKIKRYRSRSGLYKFQQKTLKNIIQYRRKVYRIIKLVYYLKKNKLRPDWLMISILPVLPPNLRPIIQLQSNQMAVSDLNQLYKRVLYRNIRIEKYLNRSRETDSHEIRFHQRLLQEAVDSLLDNGKGGSPLACSPNGRPFKSLAEILKGKKGRFRQNLLGKRVDYSGRSVIVVGPELKLHECGLPKEMALELFQPFIIRDLINLSHQATDDKITIITAKHLIRTEHSIVWQILQKILKNHPILLNRAPTLHRLGIQAFQPKLVQGRAILLHPLVCPAFNADFDGDQMAVHVPLCFQSRAEAWKLMWSRNNLLSPATGEPIVIPSQDMILGCYYLTTINSNNARRVFQQQHPSFSDVRERISTNKLKLHAKHPITKFVLSHSKFWRSNYRRGVTRTSLEVSSPNSFYRSPGERWTKNLGLQKRSLLDNLCDLFANKTFPTKVARTYNSRKSNSINIVSESRNVLLPNYILSLQNKNSLSGQRKNQFQQDISKADDINIISLGKYFSNLNDVLLAFSQNKLFLHSLIWVKWENSVELENFNEKPIEVRVDCYGNTHKIYSKYFQYVDNQNTRISQFILTTVGRIILNKALP